jgi:hypothetical protein
MESDLARVTNSAASCFRGCPRSYQYRYRDLRRPVLSAHALKFGALGHRALEAWWTKQDEERLDAALYAITFSDAEPVDKAVAIELITGYHFRWGDVPYNVIAVEKQFNIALINPATQAASRTWTLSGKLDVLVERDVLFWIIEHKFVSAKMDIRPGSVYWQRLQLDSQISTYYAGASFEGYNVAGCIYDVVHKPGIRPLKATPIENRKYKKDGVLYANQRDTDETIEEYIARLHADITDNPDSYYQRGEVFRNNAEETSAAYDIWQIARNIRECEKSGNWPRNPDYCWKYERACDYWPVCVGECSIDDPIRYRTADTAHEELKEIKEIGNENSNVCPF